MMIRACTVMTCASRLYQTSCAVCLGELAWVIAEGRGPLPAWKGTLSERQKPKLGQSRPTPCTWRSSATRPSAARRTGPCSGCTWIRRRLGRLGNRDRDLP